MATNWLLAARDALAQQFGGTTAFPEVPDYARKTPGFAAQAAPPVTPTFPTAPVGGALRTAGLTGLASFAPRSASAGFAPLGEFADFGAAGQRTAAIGPTPGFDFGTGGIRQAFNKGLQQDPQGAVPSTGAVGGLAGQSGYALLDQHNNEINAAAAKYGVPANLLKSMINRESSGDWDRDNRVYTGFRDQRMLPFVGIFESTANSWGLDFNAMIGNKQAQIDGMAKILNGLSNQYGGYENAAKVYFGGEAALSPGGFTDELDMNSAEYGQKAIDLWHQLDQQAGYTGGYDLPTVKAGETGFGNNWVVQQALQYVGVAYNWGAIPGANQNPWDTGWDCSGMTYFLNQKFGDKSIPMGSHYQYQYAQQSGQLFTDLSQLQPGDLVFIDTGWQGGAGAELNNAGHVGIYIGNGQMLHAANQQAGTIVSPLSGYGGILGAMHQSFSGGGGGTGGGGFASRNPFRFRA